MSLPIRVRLTAWYAALLGTIVTAFGVFLVLQLTTDLRRALDGELRANSATLIRAIGDEPGSPPESAADAAEDKLEFGVEAGTLLPHAQGGVQVLDAQGHVLLRYGAVADGQLLSPADARRAALSRTPGMRTLPLGAGEQHYRVLTTRFTDGGQPRLLVVAESLRQVESAVQRVVVLLLIAGPIALAGTALAGYWIARKVLRPVARMASDAEEIGIDRLGERVAVPTSADEVRHLGVTLNAMLDRIERGVAEKHRLIADASHALRTPLAVMRAEIDVSLRGDALPGAAREVLHSAREEVDRMSRTVDNLLTLAEVDEGRLELLTVRVSLGRATHDAAHRLHTLAAAKGVSLEVDDSDWAADADPRRLDLAVTNLIENAIKFTPPGGSVRVTNWSREDQVGVSVSDDGPGVPVEDRDHLFERFYRAGSASEAMAGGTGLGLAICREVALAHGGRVWVESRVGQGSTFSLALPGWRALPSRTGSAREEANTPGRT